MKRLLAILLVSLSSVCYAQNLTISVKGEVTEDTSDLDAQVYHYKEDQNDNPYAIIKVTLTNELKNDLLLDLGGLGPGELVNRGGVKDGEVWFYAPVGAKNLKFKCAGYRVVPEYISTPALKEGTVYRITLDPDAVIEIVTNPVPSTGYLKFQVSEPDAVISIGKTRNYELITQNIEGSDYAEMLDFGTYYFKIEKRLYETHEGVITFEESTPKQVIKLAPAYSYLQINSSPSGATAYVNNRKVGTTPCTTERPLPRGEVSLRLELNEYRSLKESVTIEGKGATQIVSYNLKPSFATITLTCPDKEAEIWVDQQMVGKGTWSGHLSSTSKHLVETKHAGHHSQSTYIEVVSGETKTIPLNAPVPLYGSLNIVTKPMGCEIQIDGKTLRETTPYIGQVLVGDHTVTLSKEGHQSTTIPVTIAHNQTATIEKTLQQGPTVAEMYQLGNNYYYGTNGYTKDYGKAVEWYYKAAEQGHPSAQYCLGYCYYYEKGVLEDYHNAAMWYLKAAEQGHAEAQFLLGMCYIHGNGVAKDDAKAIEWLNKAAKQGHTAAREQIKTKQNEELKKKQEEAEEAAKIKKELEKEESEKKQRKQETWSTIKRGFSAPFRWIGDGISWLDDLGDEEIWDGKCRRGTVGLSARLQSDAISGYGGNIALCCTQSWNNCAVSGDVMGIGFNDNYFDLDTSYRYHFSGKAISVYISASLRLRCYSCQGATMFVKHHALSDYSIFLNNQDMSLAELYELSGFSEPLEGIDQCTSREYCDGYHPIGLINIGIGTVYNRFFSGVSYCINRNFWEFTFGIMIF